MYIQPPDSLIVHTRGQQCIMNQSQIDKKTQFLLSKSSESCRKSLMQTNNETQDEQGSQREMKMPNSARGIPRKLKNVRLEWWPKERLGVCQEDQDELEVCKAQRIWAHGTSHTSPVHRATIMDKTLKMLSHMPYFNPCNMYLMTDIILWKLKFKEIK